MVLEAFPEVQIHVNAPDEDVYLTVDPSLLELALVNLIENAAKYSSKPAYVAVTIEAKEDSIRIDVSDRGIGIPLEDQELIFERFYTVDKAHSRRMGGSGLGLSIVKTIVEKHSGMLALVSELGKRIDLYDDIPKVIQF